MTGGQAAVGTLVVVLVVLVVLAVVASVARRQRQSLVAAWAHLHGWTVLGASGVLRNRWNAPPFRETSWTRDELGAELPRGAVTSFTHLAWRPRHVVFTRRDMEGPGLRLTPEDGWQRARAALGGQDVRLEWEAFNARWRVESRQGGFAHGVVHPRLMERLMRPDTAGLSVLVEGSDVVVWAPGRTDLGRIPAMAELVLDLAELLPRYLVDDHPPAAAGSTRREVARLRAGRWRAR